MKSGPLSRLSVRFLDFSLNISFHRLPFSLVVDGGSVNLIVPKTLAPGNYLLRNEIISLHNAQAMSQAEFYPNCANLKVGGSGKGAPKDSELVSFPGAYEDTLPGILFDPYDNLDAKYIFPGPPIASFVGTPSNDPPTPSSDDSNTPSISTTSPYSSTTPSTAPGKTCKSKRSSRKRYTSRVMQQLNDHPSKSTNSSSRYRK